MGRAERRKSERNARIENRKNQILVSRQDIGKMKSNLRYDVTKYNVEALLTCFALAEHRLYGYGKTRILRSLKYIDILMEAVTDGSVTIEDYKKALADETGVVVRAEVK